MALSKQTRNDSFFRYNPFAGSTIFLYPVDRPQRPRVFILKPDYLTGEAHALNGRIRVMENEAGQTVCKVNGKRTERFSIVYPGRKQKKVFASR